MHQNFLVRSLGAVAGVLLLASSNPAVAAEPEEGGQILFNSEFMIMDSFGTDLNVFDVKIEDDDGDSRTNGTDLEHDSDFGWRGDLQYKDGAWGFGISGFHFDTDGSEDARLNFDGNLDEQSLRSAQQGCDTDDNDHDCVADVDSDLEMWMVDLYGIRELVSTPDVNVDLQFGLRLAHYNWEGDLFSAQLEPGTDLIVDDEEPVSSDSTSEPDDDALAGPFMALFTSGRYGRFRAEAQLSQAVVFGELEQDIDRHQYFDGDEGSPTLGSLLLQETNSKSQSQDAVIPITDIRIKLGYDIMDNLTLGFGAYTTTWFNVPEVPNLESSDFANVENNRLSSDKENITLLGASFSLEYRFNGGPDLGSWMP